mmetsp:Transcript_21105/g.32720  ORF Transcript_21105/g.32720 Transcript_21105/m.32720 type:complete len:276 (+) Transcript_21105:515-1342(+)
MSKIKHEDAADKLIPKEAEPTKEKVDVTADPIEVHKAKVDLQNGKSPELIKKEISHGHAKKQAQEDFEDKKVAEKRVSELVKEVRSPLMDPRTKKDKIKQINNAKKDLQAASAAHRDSAAKAESSVHEVHQAKSAEPVVPNEFPVHTEKEKDQAEQEIKTAHVMVKRAHHKLKHAHSKIEAEEAQNLIKEAQNNERSAQIKLQKVFEKETIEAEERKVKQIEETAEATKNRVIEEHPNVDFETKPSHSQVPAGASGKSFHKKHASASSASKRAAL